MPRLRKFIALLLILALPTQGFAAAGMLACGPGHAPAVLAPEFDAPASDAPLSEAPAAESAGQSHHDHATHSHAVRNGHRAHDPAPEAAGDESAATSVAVASAMDGFDNQSTCSACASCCYGAALVPDIILPGTPDLALQASHWLTLATVSFLTDGPKRPPRPFLA
jgi:hypothetical protein